MEVPESDPCHDIIIKEIAIEPQWDYNERENGIAKQKEMKNQNKRALSKYLSLRALSSPRWKPL